MIYLIQTNCALIFQLHIWRRIRHLIVGAVVFRFGLHDHVSRVVDVIVRVQILVLLDLRRDSLPLFYTLGYIWYAQIKRRHTGVTLIGDVIALLSIRHN